MNLDSLANKQIWKSTKIQGQEIAPTGIWLVTSLVISVVLAIIHSPLVPLPGVITLLVIPGASVMTSLKSRPSNTPGRIVLAVCLSMIVVMAVGGAASLLGPPLGVAHPLNPVPEIVIWLILTALMLTVGAAKHSDPVMWIFEGVRTQDIARALVFGVLVLLSILGVAQLNHSGNNHLAVFSTSVDVIALLAGVAGGWSRTSRWPLSTLLYCVSLALLLSTSLRGAHLYGWDIQEEFGVAAHTISEGKWVIPANHDPYSSMLSLTALPAVLHSLTRLRLLAFFQLVVPAILALLPLAVFATVRNVPRWITYGRRIPRPGLAFAVVSGLIVSSVAFSSQIVSITRQAMALTMLTALIMVIFDRTTLVRPSRIIAGLLLVGISFTHYTTSYLVAGILLCAWIVSAIWSRGWLGTPKAKIGKHRADVQSRKIINVAVVVVALVAAFGWNLAITRNSALSAPSSAVTTKGVGLASTSGPSLVSPRKLEGILVSELHQTASWISPAPGSGSVPLVASKPLSSPGVVGGLSGFWNFLCFLCGESIWVILGVALLYGLFYLGRRQSFQYTPDLVGVGVAGLALGGILRFSGTLAAYYSPERAAIFTAILLAAPVTLFLDDAVSLTYEASKTFDDRVVKATLTAGALFLGILLVWATGLGFLFFGGQPPGSLSSHGANVEQFTVSTQELATAVWLQTYVSSPNTVQSDAFGHLVLLSEPGSYDSLDEIVPPGVDEQSFVYLSTVNLADRVTTADADNGIYFSSYRSNIRFFNRSFYVVYSTGATRVYH